MQKNQAPAVPCRDLMGKVRAEPSAAIQTRVFCNAQMGSRHIRAHCAVDPDSRRLLESAVDKLGLSARAYNRILKIARTLADLAGSKKIRTGQIAEAIQYRSLDRGKRIMQRAPGPQTTFN